MGWQRLCELATLPVGSAALFKVGASDVLFLRARDGYIAMPAPCRNMRHALTERHVDECFDNGIPVCNRRHNEAGALEGVVGAPLWGYATREKDGVVYIDLGRESIPHAYQYMTCSPQMTSAGDDELVISLWREGYENEKETIHYRAALKLHQP